MRARTMVLVALATAFAPSCSDSGTGDHGGSGGGGSGGSGGASGGGSGGSGGSAEGGSGGAAGGSGGSGVDFVATVALHPLAAITGLQDAPSTEGLGAALFDGTGLLAGTPTPLATATVHGGQLAFRNVDITGVTAGLVAALDPEHANADFAPVLQGVCSTKCAEGTTAQTLTLTALPSSIEEEVAPVVEWDLASGYVLGRVQMHDRRTPIAGATVHATRGDLVLIDFAGGKLAAPGGDTTFTEGLFGIRDMTLTTISVTADGQTFDDQPAGAVPGFVFLTYMNAR